MVDEARKAKLLAKRAWAQRPEVVAVRAAGKCGSRTRADPPTPCSKLGLLNGRCRFHGGRATGPKVWKAGGRYSKGLGALAAQWHDLLDASDLLDTAPSLALMDLATNLRLERGLERQDTPLFREEARRLLRAVHDAAAADGSRLNGGASAALDRLEDLIEEGVKADQAVAEAVEIAHKRNLQATRVTALQLQADSSVPKATVTALLAVISAVIREHAPAESPAIFADVSAQLLGISRRIGQPLRLGEGAAVYAAAAVPG